jgi:glucose-6-phosphate 1-dehydrogenase
MQNHLLQILALVAMEPPARLDPVNIASEKVKLLRCIPPIKRDDLVLGQYVASEKNGRRFPGYVNDPGVPDDSVTPTFTSARLKIDCPRWDGVPFVMSAGKGLDARMTEIRIRFRDVPGNMFCQPSGCPDSNQMVIRVQPDEAIRLSLTNKVPGMGLELRTGDLDLHYKEAFSEIIPDAYESLLLDVITGDRSLFIQKKELEAAWDIFTPVLHETDRAGAIPEPYEFGSDGPQAANRLMP